MMMKRIIIAIGFACSALFASAQTAVKGDMNNDGQITIADLTSLVETANGRMAKQAVEVTDPYQNDDTQLVGVWVEAESHVSFVLSADGSCSLGTDYTYEYRPQQGTLIILDGGGLETKVYHVLSLISESLLLNEVGSTTLLRYTKDTRSSAIILSEPDLSARVGRIYRLKAGMLPSDAAMPTLKWTSSDKSVASVSSSGYVTANGVGTCKIIVEDESGSAVTGVCKVTVKKALDAGEHAYVDLGLPSGTLWATCNVGASQSEDRGGFFAFGETEEKGEYDWLNYKWTAKGYGTQTKYCTSSELGTVDYKTELDMADDVAQVTWGGDWRMPSDEDFQELIDNCTITGTELWRGSTKMYGLKVVGSNGSSIFLPAAEYRSGTHVPYEYTCGSYWSRTLTSDDSSKANGLFFQASSSKATISSSERLVGNTVRPVIPVRDLE